MCTRARACACVCVCVCVCVLGGGGCQYTPYSINIKEPIKTINQLEIIKNYIYIYIYYYGIFYVRLTGGAQA